MKLVKRLANLGYGSRKEVQRMIRAGQVTDDAGQSLDEDDPMAHERIRWSGAPLDPASPFTLMLHKPDGFTCSLNDPGKSFTTSSRQGSPGAIRCSVRSADSTKTPPDSSS
ncbi:MAG: hypothetical protein R3F31_25110 [Verrucomicrobiales bacterium]